MRKTTMKYFTRERIVRLVTMNKVTKFVAKLFFLFSSFKNGENVCLIINYRSFIASDIIIFWFIAS